MILALSKVATLLGNSSNLEFTLNTLGSELRDRFGLWDRYT